MAGPSCLPRPLQQLPQTKFAAGSGASGSGASGGSLLKCMGADMGSSSSMGAHGCSWRVHGSSGRAPQRVHIRGSRQGLPVHPTGQLEHRQGQAAALGTWMPILLPLPLTLPLPRSRPLPLRLPLPRPLLRSRPLSFCLPLLLPLPLLLLCRPLPLRPPSFHCSCAAAGGPGQGRARPGPQGCEGCAGCRLLQGHNQTPLPPPTS